MKGYRIVPGSHFDGLETFELTDSPLGERDVRVRVGAVALNYRDLMVARGDYASASRSAVIPASDGAGEVVETGAGVSRFSAGDRVAGIFFPDWLSGHPTPEQTARALGGATDGMLAEEVVLHEDALVSIPAHLSFAEAATLPCAAVTAWNALFAQGGLRPGSSVLLLGTGGVSIWALQLAKAAGLSPFITSSSDDKLERARELGAEATINYRDMPQWQDEVLRLTNGRGVDLVVEVGGQGTLPRSIAATAMGGTIAVIGGVTGFGGDVPPGALIHSARSLTGIYVGSRVMFEDLNRLVAVSGIRPVVDRVFAFDEAPQAYHYVESGRHFGKVVIDVAQ